jgi:hypothetical protein
MSWGTFSYLSRVKLLLSIFFYNPMTVLQLKTCTLHYSLIVESPQVYCTPPTMLAVGWRWTEHRTVSIVYCPMSMHVPAMRHRLNKELDLQNLFGLHVCTAVLIG